MTIATETKLALLWNNRLDKRIKKNNRRKFWEILERIIGKILSILGSDLMFMIMPYFLLM